ncbi:unnamed protein product [Peniophora sp. CBMAI 1063]|nr:unnamed protein product [Peniophora sp. CBMAI 1063]
MKQNDRHTKTPHTPLTSTPTPNTEKSVAAFLKGLKSTALRNLFPGPRDRLNPTPFPCTPGQHDIHNLQAGQKISDTVWIAHSERGNRPATVMWPHVEGFGQCWEAEEFHCVVHIVHTSDAIKIYKDRTKEDMLVPKKFISDAQEGLFLRIVPYYDGERRASGRTCQVDHSQLLVMREWVCEAPRWDGAQSGAGESAAPVLIVGETAYEGSIVSLALLLAATKGELAQATRDRLVATAELKPQWKEAMARLTSADFELLNRILTEG